MKLNLSKQHISKWILVGIVGGIIVALININITSYKEARHEHITEKLETVNTVTYRDTVDGVDWYTYRNGVYGYEISYPETVSLSRSSEMNRLGNSDEAKKDYMVFLKDPVEEYSFTISVGVEIGTEIQNIEDLEQFQINTIIPRTITNYTLKGTKYEISDFVNGKTNLFNKSAVTLNSPVGYSIRQYSDDGNVLTVMGIKYTGATTTSKERNTRAIMETFRVLD